MKFKILFISVVVLGLTGCFGPELQPVTLKVAGINGGKLTFKFANPKNNNESAQPDFDCGFSKPVTYNDASVIRGLRVAAEIHQRNSDDLVTSCRLLDHQIIEDKLANI